MDICEATVDSSYSSERERQRQTFLTAKMPSYKVTYFDIKGLAESIRWIFAHAGVEFEDKRVSADEWKTLKPTMPMNQLPVLEVDGKRVNQSMAICRYLAKQFGLAGKNDWENLQIDSVVDSIGDLRTKIVSYWFEKVEEAKAEKKKAAEETTELFVKRFDEMVKANGGYFVGGRVTWADIVFCTTLEIVNPRMNRDIIEKAENLKSLRDKVQSAPGIKAWLAKRPKTEF